MGYARHSTGELCRPYLREGNRLDLRFARPPNPDHNEIVTENAKSCRSVSDEQEDEHVAQNQEANQ